MCGVESRLLKTKIEGAFLNVCSKCAISGEIIQESKKTVTINKKNFAVIERKEIIQIIDKNYSSIIKNKREKMNLKQKELAQKIAEKESVLHNLESGNSEPNIKLARKLEKFLGIVLVQEFEDKFKSDKQDFSGEVTIGDLIKIKSK